MQNERILDSAKYGGSSIEIVEIPCLDGAKNATMARQAYYLRETKATLKFVRIHLNNDKVTTEAGALYYTKGNIKNDTPIGGVGGFLGKALKAQVTQEAAFNPTYEGTGIVVLEPTFGHYVLLELNNNSVIVDKSLYYCHIGDIRTEAVMQNNLSSAALGGEGLFQTRITGTGVVVLEIPVPMSEIEMFNLNNEKVQVDGNFAILRSASIDFRVEKSNKGILGSVVGGEGLLCTFTGSGMIWLAPTAPIYNRICMNGFNSVQSGASNHIQ